MTFGEIAVEEAVGAISVHGVMAGGVRLKKGGVVSAEDAAALLSAGHRTIVAARLETHDVGEDQAAGALAAAAAGSGTRVEPAFTGRANLFAATDGMLVLEAGLIGRLNDVDEAVTLATLPAYKPVVAGEMIATVKIVPYGVERTVLETALAVAAPRPPIRVEAYRIRRVGVVSTELPALKQGVIEKTVRVLERRLAPSGAVVAASVSCPHAPEPLAAALRARREAGNELAIVFGASAISDRRDVIPAGIERAGGRVIHLGMPVDPGNLLLLGDLDGMPVVGAPGCARSPKENGFDWILRRLLAGLPVGRRDITALGVGGLLMEIGSRGQPRAGGARDPDEDE